ncbi:TraB/GumN family protein [Glaciecola sp. XM2]|jgi:uncharacterized protein YbaP (TraB family)|uniref:TraB/GumN family protein n=1 Tax=Glaciecola sp. XM2 TaxID=1914931 RepID=UPI001BDEFBAA|nr:TraB/GumN family protein [Glaciecola sp. XM2]MBT1450309.1 TraB/GumN family protein [Glaciecola sp. XM2]
MKVLIISLLILLGSTSFNAQSAAVFKVSKGDDVVYVGGTIHLLTDADFPLAQAYEIAFEAADELVFETDIAAFSDPSIQAKMAPVMLQAPGVTLSSQLSAPTATALNAYLTEKGLPVAQFDMLTATGAMLTLTIMEYQAQGFRAEGVDAFYHAKGLEMGKGIAWLESVESQIALLDSFDDGNPDGLISYTLEEIDKSAGMIDKLHNAWKSGDLAALEEAGLVDMKRDFPEIYQTLMVDRNNKWMPQIEAMFGDDDTEYVLVGAAHLAGDEGVLEMLEAKGYKVERL